MFVNILHLPVSYIIIFLNASYSCHGLIYARMYHEYLGMRVLKIRRWKTGTKIVIS